MGSVLVGRAIEALFDLSAECDKTRANCRLLTAYVEHGQSDRDRAYQVIRDMYARRSSVVHYGGRVTVQEAIQSYHFAKVPFRRCIIEDRLPAISAARAPVGQSSIPSVDRTPYPASTVSEAVMRHTMRPSRKQ